VDSGAFVPHGTVLTITATPNDGYRLAGLTVNGHVFESGNTHEVISATDIYAYFVEVGKYGVTLIVEPLGAGTVTGYGEYAAGDSVTITATPAENYRFIEWLDDAEQVISTSATYGFIMPEGDIIYTAVFALIQYEVTFNTPANGTLTVTIGEEPVTSGDLVDHGTVLTIVATPDANYELDTLTVNDAVFTSGSTYEVVGTTIIVCVFKEVQGSNILPTEITTPVAVWISNGVLHIAGLLHGELYQIYSVSGTMLYQGIVTSDPVQIENIRIQSGAYILRTATQSVKFIK
jgi:hypothetical protein